MAELNTDKNSRRRSRRDFYLVTLIQRWHAISERRRRRIRRCDPVLAIALDHLHDEHLGVSDHQHLTTHH